jgi:CRISPR/Cas system CSM-associated protein Csm4 (group 5 of RAMP superfamily)
MKNVKEYLDAVDDLFMAIVTVAILMNGTKWKKLKQNFKRF